MRGLSKRVLENWRWTAPADGGMPASWCGTPTAADQIANAKYPPELSQIKIVYAYAADQPNRVRDHAQIIQNEVRIATDFFAAESQGKIPRWDLGNDCSIDVVDIAVLALKHPLSYYQEPRTRFARLRSEAQEFRVRAGIPPHWNVVIYADRTSDGTGTAGQAELIINSRKQDNPHADGGLHAFIYGNKTGEGEWSYWGPGALIHEVIHTLGAVQPDAPHATPYGHCTDGNDIMCYADSEDAVMKYLCPNPWPAYFRGGIDCNRDTYFSPAPAEGSYLATHWNIYDSPFLCGMEECGLVTSPPPPPSASPRRPSPPRSFRKLRRVGVSWMLVRWRKSPSAEMVRRYEVVRGRKRIASRQWNRGSWRYARVRLSRLQRMRVRVRAVNRAGRSRPSTYVVLPKALRRR